ncbi:MAG: thioredoxin family protein, partial [Gammaproteobacteria bacterium]
MDGALQAPDGLSDVCQRGVAGLGAGPPERHRRHGRAAGHPGGAGLPGLVVRRGRTPAPGLAVALAAVLWAGPLLSPVQGGERWQSWSASAVDSALAQGRPVFVDFTAAWCVTCQFNKRTALADASVLADFDRRKVVLLRADWTRRDAAIGAELTRLGRSGVPVYALYAPGAAQPELLPEILSAQRVRESLSRLPAASPPSP